MPKPHIIAMTDGSRVAVWPNTGRATVARYGAGTFDQDREPCAAGDFVAEQRDRQRLKALFALARAAASGDMHLRGGHD